MNIVACSSACETSIPNKYIYVSISSFAIYSICYVLYIILTHSSQRVVNCYHSRRLLGFRPSAAESNATRRGKNFRATVNV